MNAKELIGKNAIREKPIKKAEVVSSGLYTIGSRVQSIPDYTYCVEPVKIINATDHHVVIEREVFGKIHMMLLDERYCDDAWTDYDELIGGKNHVPEK
ncbi:hypothetical protein [Flavonifractor plautii]|jgi:hypothetical protein|uniref:hypothetical protein n=1 Tax=Flavonifractor plautii TaxID=292800 RepID=UPI0018984056|nr:hypothetical protein [Flavonifractor plautii]